MFSEHNDVGINGQPNDSSTSAIPADAVNGLDEIPKRQCLLFVIGFHAMTVSREALRALWGVDPTGDFRILSDLWVRRQTVFQGYGGMGRRVSPFSD